MSLNNYSSSAESYGLFVSLQTFDQVRLGF